MTVHLNFPAYRYGTRCMLLTSKDGERTDDVRLVTCERCLQRHAADIRSQRRIHLTSPEGRSTCGKDGMRTEAIPEVTCRHCQNILYWRERDNADAV